MPTQAELDPKSSALLIVHSDGGTWALPGSSVVGIEPYRADSSRELLDVQALLGASPFVVQSDARVVVLSVHGERLNLLVQGLLRLTDVASAQLLALPHAVRAAAPLVSHVALVDGKPSLYVVSPERLLEAARSKDHTLPVILEDSVRGSSC